MGKEIQQPDWESIVSDPKLVQSAKQWWFGTPGVAVIKDADGRVTNIKPLNIDNQKRYPRDADGVTWYIGPYGIRSKTEESIYQSSNSSSSRARRSRTMQKRLQRGGERSSASIADTEKRNRIFNIEAVCTNNGFEVPTIIPDYAIMIQACRGQDFQALRVLNRVLDEGWGLLMPHGKADIFEKWANREGANHPSVLKDALIDTLAAAQTVIKSGRFSPGLAVFPDSRQADNAILATLAKVPFITNDNGLLKICKQHDLPVFSPTEFLQSIQD